METFGFTAKHRYISQADSLLLFYWTLQIPQECEKDKPQRILRCIHWAALALPTTFIMVNELMFELNRVPQDSGLTPN